MLNFFLSACLLTAPVALDAARQPAEPYLAITVPAADTVVTELAIHRVGGHTMPGSQVTVAGTPVRVYSSGAFTGMIEPPVGYSRHLIEAVSPASDTLRAQLLFYRVPPPEPMPHFPVAIDTTSLRPHQDLWLQPGEEFEVRFRGSSGQEAFFDIPGVALDVPMRELSPDEAGGLSGVYRGTYFMGALDRALDQPVKVRLRRAFFGYERRQVAGRITVVRPEEPVYVKTRGFRPYFRDGTGTDRLGGVRLGYVEEGILVQVTGKQGPLYRVRLAAGATAWLEERFAVPDSVETLIPGMLTGPPTVASTSRKTMITLPLSRRLAWLSRQLAHPATIEVDLFGVDANTNWAPQNLAAGNIRRIDWKQLDPDHLRLSIYLKGNRHWGYRIGYSQESTLEIHVNSPPEGRGRGNSLKGIRIAIDAGHGGSNLGAIGSLGIPEKEPALDIARKLAAALQHRGVEVIMTRTDDRFVGMVERQQLVLAADPHMLVSIHLNSVGYATNPERIQGTSVYYRHVGFKPLADLVYRKMVELRLSRFGVVGNFNFVLNQFTEFPNVLIETGFISNPEDELRLLDPRFQQLLADKIAEALAEFVR